MDTEQKISEVGLRHSAAVLHPAGTVMLCRTASVGLICLIGQPMATTQAFVTWTPGPRLDSRYLMYVLHAMKPEWERLAYGSTHMTIYMPDLESLVVPVCALSQQRAIADFLDRETARIDALIAAKRRMIDLAKERAEAFVAVSMTFGLEEASRTQTGSPFAPEVRSGWSLQRLRHVVSEIVDTAHKTAPVIDGGRYLVVRTANVKSGRLVLEGAHYTDEESWREWTARGVPRPGDVIFTREAPAGEACLVPEGVPLCIGQRTVLLRPDNSKVLGEWILHSIYSGAARRFIEVLSKSTTVAHINMSDIPDIPLALPTLAEQEHVLDAVRTEMSRLAGIQRSLTQQISLLVERRQALITAAVTGQIEVPGVAE